MHRSPEYSGRNRRRLTMAAGLARTAMVLSVLGFGAAAGISQSSAQTAGAEIGYVVALTGPVVMHAGATPVLLDPLDGIRDRARLELPAGSEARVCHYPTQRQLTLKGPLRASVSTQGVTAENGKPLDLAAIPCAMPRASKHQGGLVARGVILTGAQ